jgi:membrane-associated phospholipid phosphatase
MLQLDTHPASSIVPVPAQNAAARARRSPRTGRLLILAGGLLALAAAALWVDLALAAYIERNPFSGELRRLIRLGEVFGWGGTVALIILTAAALDRRGWRVAPRLAFFSLGAGLLADGVKLLIGRWRPSAAPAGGDAMDTFVAWLPAFRADNLELRYGHALQSFPSGHAAAAAGLAIGLSMLYPRGRWLFALFAVLAALQRVEARAHFASDVLAGAALACVVAAICEYPAPLGRWLARLEKSAA